MFEAWKASSRNDALLYHGVAYSTPRWKHARTLAAQGASFMSGAFRSPAADAVARGCDPTCGQTDSRGHGSRITFSRIVIRSRLAWGGRWEGQMMRTYWAGHAMSEVSSHSKDMPIMLECLRLCACFSAEPGSVYQNAYGLFPCQAALLWISPFGRGPPLPFCCLGFVVSGNNFPYKG